MNSSERLAETYLRSLGYADIVHEPDGNKPPDFLVDGRIAVEVRRLNQNTSLNNNRPEGLEEIFIPFWQRMQHYLPTLGIGGNESWYVGVRIKRPLESWKTLEPILRSALMKFMYSEDRVPKTIRISPHLEINLAQAGKVYSSFYRLGIGLDKDAGGFVISKIYRNLNLCISDKNKKIAPYRNKYSEWWLVLLDHIGLGADVEDRRQLRDLPQIEHSWDKVILLNPLNTEDSFEFGG